MLEQAHSTVCKRGIKHFNIYLNFNSIQNRFRAGVGIIFLVHNFKKAVRQTEKNRTDFYGDRRDALWTDCLSDDYSINIKNCN